MTPPSPAEVTVILSIIFLLLIIAVVLIFRIPTRDPNRRNRPCPPSPETSDE